MTLGGMVHYTVHYFLAMKIQCSDSTAQLLKILGGFQLECRGNISVKV